MPVSLERLITEVEPNVITESITRECIQVQGNDSDSIEEKRRTMQFKEIESLSFSFRQLAKISSLEGLINLTKLQLDNNHIQKVENIGHLVNLTWLDLSFNKLTKIEGVETLTKLSDLSLFNNQIVTVENLEKLSQLNVLSLGNNCIKLFDNVMYLRQFRNLRLLNLAGNPICANADYKSYVLSHVKGLVYLDYMRVNQTDVASALENHQDEMIEVQEKEEQAAAEEKLAGERATHNALLVEANLVGVESLLEDTVRDDAEWAKLAMVPGLLDGWNDVRDKFNLATEEFKEALTGYTSHLDGWSDVWDKFDLAAEELKVLILEQHAKKKAEFGEWRTVVQQVLDEKDNDAKRKISAFEKSKKQVRQDIAQNPADAETLLLAPKAKLLGLKEVLMQLEVDVVEALSELCREFDRSYSEIAEINRSHYAAYFTQVRDLVNQFFNSLTGVSIGIIEKYNQDNSDMDGVPEDARVLLQDKDTLTSALQASRDHHTGRIDTLEERLVAAEARSAADLGTDNARWEGKRNRDRVSEIINYLELNMMELEELAGEEEDMS